MVTSNVTEKKEFQKSIHQFSLNTTMLTLVDHNKSENSARGILGPHDPFLRTQVGRSGVAVRMTWDHRLAATRKEHVKAGALCHPVIGLRAEVSQVLFIQ